MPKAEKLATFKCQLSGKCESLSFPEPQGPVQACIGIALPFYIYLPIRKKKTCVFAVSLHLLNSRVSNTFLVINDNIILERLCLSGSQIGTFPRHAIHNIYTLAIRNSNNAPPNPSADLKNNTSGNSAYERPTKYSRANTLPFSSVFLYT